jgi:molybdenum cofactor synthesis domain-containing protein
LNRKQSANVLSAVMLPVPEAVHIVLAQAAPLPAESVPLVAAQGRVLAEKVLADSDLPPFDRAQMDGYAVRSDDLQTVPARLKIVGEAAAGAGWHSELRAGEAVRIMTGAPVPAGADSVQKVEVTREDGRFIVIDKPTKAGQFIVPRASEIRAGEVVLRAGEIVNAAKMAALASFGYAQVSVGARPRVAILATGSELARVDETPARDQIRDSNTYSLAAYAALAGATVERLPLAGDDPQLLQNVIADAAQRADVLVLSGGVSMGVYDFTKTALRALGAEIYFERVSLRPGKPTVFARLGRTLAFGLPGNPVSVSVTFNLFVRPALLALQGAAEPTPPHDTAILSNAVKGSLERASYLPARLRTNDAGQLVAEPLKWGGSSDFVAFTRAAALIIVPAGARRYEAGQLVNVVKLPA